MDLQLIMSKSAAKLEGLNPIVRAKAEQLLQNTFVNRGVAIRIVQGLRTMDEQQALYNQGRYGNPGPVVTNAKPGQSYHNWGLAIDFCLLIDEGHDVSWDENADYNGDGLRDWAETVNEAKKLGFAWGGDWDTFKDTPHFEYTFGLSYQDLMDGAKPPTVDPNVQPPKPPQPVIESCHVKMNGENLYLDCVVIEGVSYIPVRGFADRFGATVGWNPYTKQASVNNILLTTTKVLNNISFARTSEFAKAMGIESVGWDQASQTILLTDFRPCAVQFNNKPTPIKAALVMSRSYVAVRDLAILAGATVGWDAVKQQVILNGKNLLTSHVWNNDGYAHSVEIANALGLKLGWNGATNTVLFEK